MEARVIKLSGIGSDPMRQAIESGILTAEAKRECERLLKENRQLRTALTAARADNRRLEDLNNAFRGSEMARIREAIKAEEIGRDRQAVILAIAVSVGAFLTMIGTAIALLLL